MRVVRCGVFETNSSSCHSLTITGLTMNDDKYNDVLTIQPDEYGWHGPLLYAPEDKTSYFATGIQYLDKYYNGYLNKQELDVEQTDEWKLLCEIWKEYNGTLLKYKEMKGMWPAGYIDHESVHITSKIWNMEGSSRKYKLRDLIFNDDCTISILNDNDWDGEE